MTLAVTPRTAEPPGSGTDMTTNLMPDTPVEAPVRGSLTIGLLVPFHPGARAAGRHFLQGVELGLAGATGVPAMVVDVEVGVGYVEAADSLVRLLDDGAQVVVAAVNEPVAELLASICRSRGVGLVVAGVGSESAAVRGPGVVHCTQQHWQAMVAMGDWAARHLDDGLFQVVSAPDAEYDAVRALRLGFEAAGGRVSGRATTHDRYDSTGVAEAAVAARASGARTVAVHATGHRLTEVVRGLRRAGVQRRDRGRRDRARRGRGRPAAGAPSGLYSTSSWCRSDAADFAGAFHATTGETADAFAAVGYDAALLVAEAARRMADGGGSWSALDEVLAGATLDGSRGPLVVDAATASATTLAAGAPVARRAALRRGSPHRRPGAAGQRRHGRDRTRSTCSTACSKADPAAGLWR